MIRRSRRRPVAGLSRAAILTRIVPDSTRLTRLPTEQIFCETPLQNGEAGASLSLRRQFRDNWNSLDPLRHHHPVWRSAVNVGEKLGLGFNQQSTLGPPRDHYISFAGQGGDKFTLHTGFGP